MLETVTVKPKEEITSNTTVTDPGITFFPSTTTTLGPNGDETKYPVTYIGSYSKGLPHEDNGLVVPEAFAQFVGILEDGRFEVFADLPLAGPRPLVNPQAGLALDRLGPAPKSLTMPAAPGVDSAETAAEMVEIYWMSLLRDVPFIDWESELPNGIAEAAHEISNLKDFTGPRRHTGTREVTPRTLFRGVETGNNVGPYLSQFLLRDVPFGSLTTVQRQRTVLPDRNYLTRFDEYLAVQNGTLLYTADTFDATPRYLRTLRDLGQYVHVDALSQAYLNAALILLRDCTPFDSGNPYVGASNDKSQPRTQTGFATFGSPHLLALVTEVATRALKAVWWQKWFVHRRLRPENYGALVERHRHLNLELPQQVLESEAVRRVQSVYGSQLLPMQFPEGSPNHPSYGAGHATVAGACVTLLKAWFDEKAPLAQPPVVGSADGITLVPYNGTDSGSLTVAGELNKLAANIALGRSGAGVHWRSDYYHSLRLGEQVALALLVNESSDFNESFSLTFTNFDGREIRVTGGPNHQPGTAHFTDDGTPVLITGIPS